MGILKVFAHKKQRNIYIFLVYPSEHFHQIRSHIWPHHTWAVSLKRKPLYIETANNLLILDLLWEKKEKEQFFFQTSMFCELMEIWTVKKH